MYPKRYRELEILALYLGDYGRQLYLREISERARVPLRTTQNAIAGLEKERILKSAVKGKNKYFRLNLDDAHTKLRLLQAELHKTEVFLDKYPLLKTFLKALSTNDAILVFGSFAKFAADEKSDLDLLIVSREKLPLHLLPYKVHEIRSSEAEFIKSLERGETLLKEIAETHILLNNHSFFVNALWNYYAI